MHRGGGLVSGSSDHTILVWNALAEPVQMLTGHEYGFPNRHPTLPPRIGHGMGVPPALVMPRHPALTLFAPVLVSSRFTSAP